MDIPIDDFSLSPELHHQHHECAMNHRTGGEADQVELLERHARYSTATRSLSGAPR
jgi:hypothetical protein